VEVGKTTECTSQRQATARIFAERFYAGLTTREIMPDFNRYLKLK
jgi:hypothetical protein